MKLANVTNLDQIKELIRNETNKEPYALTIYRDFIDFTGNRNGALVLQEVCYWSTKKSESGGWFYQPFEPATDGSSSTSWRQNTYLNEKTVRQWLTAFQELGIIETARHRVGPKGTPRAFYRVVWDKFLPNLLDFLKSGFSVVKETIKKIRDNLRERRIKRQAEKEAQQNVSVIEPEVKEAEVNMFEEPVAEVDTYCAFLDEFEPFNRTPLVFTELNNEVSVENIEVLVEEKVNDHVCDHINQFCDHIEQVVDVVQADFVEPESAIIVSGNQTGDLNVILTKNIYNQNKPFLWGEVITVNKAVGKKLSAFIKECSTLGYDPEEVMRGALTYANSDKWISSRRWSFINFMTNGKPIEYYELWLQGQDQKTEPLKPTPTLQRMLDAERERHMIYEEYKKLPGLAKYLKV